MGCDGGYMYFDVKDLNEDCIAGLADIIREEHFSDGPNGDCYQTYVSNPKPTSYSDQWIPKFYTLEEKLGIPSWDLITLEMIQLIESHGISILKASDYPFLKFDVVRFSWGDNVSKTVNEMIHFLKYTMNIDPLIDEETWT